MHLMPLLSAHTRELSPIAWIALILIILFVFFLNFSLVSALRRKNNSEFQTLQRFIHAIRDPNQKEKDKMTELRKRVQRLRGEEDDK